MRARFARAASLHALAAWIQHCLHARAKRANWGAADRHCAARALAIGFYGWRAVLMQVRDPVCMCVCMSTRACV
jgi:hypothetical protein